MEPQVLSATLHPPALRFPSLRVLGLRGVHHPDYGSEKALPVLSDKSAGYPDVRKSLVEVIRGENRQRYIDIVW